MPARLLPLALSVLVVGCAQEMASPTPVPTGNQAPMALRNFRVATADGHRAVLLRLSRPPTQVRHSSKDHPARIIVRASGPASDGDLAERNMPQLDPQISSVRVSRKNGALQVILDLIGDNPPPYSVHEMADWIMIRFPGPAS
ncbi:MAG: hypothetical protein ACE5I7_13230 [Candidatus Binatia bacterium]